MQRDLLNPSSQRSLPIDEILQKSKGKTNEFKTIDSIYEPKKRHSIEAINFKSLERESPRGHGSMDNNFSTHARNSVYATQSVASSLNFGEINSRRNSVDLKNPHSTVFSNKNRTMYNRNKAVVSKKFDKAQAQIASSYATFKKYRRLGMTT